MGDSSIRREKDDRQPPLDEEGWETAASGGKMMTNSRLWMKKDGDSSIRREKDDRQHPLEEEGWKTAASGEKRMTDSSLWMKKDDWQTAISGQTDKRGQKGVEKYRCVANVSVISVFIFLSTYISRLCQRGIWPEF